MRIVTKSVDVAAPLADTVRRWSNHERSSGQSPDTLPSFQWISDEITRVVLTAGPRPAAFADVVELMLENELMQFKEFVEHDRIFPSGIVQRLPWIHRALRRLTSSAASPES